jgi:hypothetical protein
VQAEDFIIGEGSTVDGGAIVSKSFVGQGCQIGKQFSSEGSAFFANCEGFHGEACSVFAGPYTVTHHKSTLLIAGMFSFYNAGSGTNQSNHLYKLGPLHEGKLERGCKTGSFSYMMWPCRVGPVQRRAGQTHADIRHGRLPVQLHRSDARRPLSDDAGIQPSRRSARCATGRSGPLATVARAMSNATGFRLTS